MLSRFAAAWSLLTGDTDVGKFAFKHNLHPQDARFALDAFDRYRFDLETYVDMNRDLTGRCASRAALLGHWIRHGAREGRFLVFDCTVDDVLAFRRDARMIDGNLARSLERCLVASLLHRAGSVLDAGPSTISALQEVAAKCGFVPYLVIGDSHSTAFRLPYFVSRDLLPIWACCWGGSARGLSNPRSKLRYGLRVLDFLDSVGASRGNLPIILCFGQVDVEFVHYFNLVSGNSVQSYSHNDMMAFIEDTIIRYLQFLTSLQTRNHKLTVAGIFPPSLYDDTIRAGYLLDEVARESELPFELLRERMGTLNIPTFVERTAIHRLFNERLSQACAAANIPYFDLFRQLLGPDGIVEPRYMYKPPGAEHHLHYNSFNRLILEQMKKVVL